MDLKIHLSGFPGALFAVWFLTMWVGGAVLAKGGFATFVCFIFFPYSFYLVLERLFSLWGLL